MFRMVPASTTAVPFESDPIFTSLYCADSCSCRETACALANDIGKMVAARSTIPAIRAWNFCDIVNPPVRFFPKFDSERCAEQRVQSQRHPTLPLLDGSMIGEPAVLQARSKARRKIPRLPA